jgi:hypothetical protein
MTLFVRLNVSEPQILRLRPSGFAQDDTGRIAHLTLIEPLDVDELIMSEKGVFRE